MIQLFQSRGFELSMFMFKLHANGIVIYVDPSEFISISLTDCEQDIRISL